MSSHEREAMDCLFGGQDMELMNIRFFRGDDTGIIAKEVFRDEFCASVARVKSGAIKRSSTPPRCIKQPVDVLALVADM